MALSLLTRCPGPALPRSPQSRNVEEVAAFLSCLPASPSPTKPSSSLPAGGSGEDAAGGGLGSGQRQPPGEASPGPGQSRALGEDRGARCGPTQSTVAVCDFLQVDGGPRGPPGARGRKGARPTCPVQLQKAAAGVYPEEAALEQVGADIPVGSHGAVLGGLGRAALQWAGS